MSAKNKAVAVKTESKEEDNESVEDVKESLRLIEDLKFFLATAPANWQENQVIRRYYLNHDEGFVSCVFWNNLYFVTGTDIVRCIVYKFEHFGRKIIDRKKFEEGIFSDLRNLKCGTDAILEPPRSEFLEFLFKNSCLRTQKKQKVFFWFNVPHDKLMADALERDLKKEKLGQKPTTIAHREPAKTFKYDETKSLYQQLAEHMEKQKKLNESPLDSNTPELKSSPEYTSSSTIDKDKDKDNYEFTNQATPAQYKTNSDYDDDFPLDYFDSTGEIHNDSNDYINLDSNTHHSGYSTILDENYESLVDPSVFIHPNIPTPATSQLVYNDEYLIEQTQPLKTPLPPISSTSLPPKSAKFPPPILPSASEEFFPSFPPPLSAKFQTSFPRNPVAPPYLQSQHNQQHTQQSNQQQSQQAQYYNDHSNQQFPSLYSHSIDGPVSFNYLHQDSDYWLQPPPSATYGGSMEQMMPIPVNQQYMIMNDQEYIPQNSMYQVMNPAMMNVFSQGQYTMNPISYSSASSRQQKVSAKMMKKKRQMFQQQPITNSSISKVIIDKQKQKTIHRNLDEVINSKSTSLINFKENSKSSESTEVLMPTPDSSVTNSSYQGNSTSLSTNQ